MQECIMGVDFGTSKIAVVLACPRRNKILAIASQDVDSYIHLSDSRLKEQDVNRIIDAFVRCAGEVFAKREYSVLSIGLTGQMHGILGIDSNGRAVTNFVTWQDGRGLLSLGNRKTVLEAMKEKGGDRQIASGYGIVTLFDWVRTGGEKKIHKLCTIADYIGMLLTGRAVPLLDTTMADSIGSFKIETLSWDFEYISKLGIDPGYFPDIVAPGTPAGIMGKKNIFNIPCNTEIPVSVSIGDNQASFIGSVKEYYNTLLINIGTASQISFALKDFKEKEIASHIDGYDVCVRPFIDGYLVAGNALSGGSSYRTIRDFFLQTGTELFGIKKEDEIWDRMNRCALGADPDTEFSVYPLFAGKRSKPDERGRIVGISEENFTPSNLIYGTLRGMIVVLKEMIDQFPLQRVRYFVGSGNGIRKNQLLREAASLVFHRDILVPRFAEEAGIGAALNGAVGAGIYSTFSQAQKIIQYDRWKQKGYK